MSKTYTECRQSMDEIASTITATQRQFDNMGQQLQNLIATFTSLPATYSEVLTTINADPGVEPSWAILKSELSQITPDYQNLQTDLQELLDKYIEITTPAP